MPWIKRGTRGLVRTAVFTVLVGGMATPAAAGDGTADLSVSGGDARAVQTSETAWSLDKTGSRDAATQTITWTVSATRGATGAGELVVSGTMTLENSGQGGASIGNILVNLQTKSGSSWVTRSTDIADATAGDAATSANVMAAASSAGTFREDAASGELKLMDANTNTVFPLVPQQTIGAGETRPLLFAATFDNHVLGLPAGTKTRVEVIVSFGNATAHGNSASDIDINGNGVIDADEAHVRSVPTRLGLTVPPETPGNADVTLSDTAGDITTTGTVTLDNPVVDLGPTGGTVTVGYDPGADGGSITNCAHLTGDGTTVTSGGLTFPGVGALDLEACNTQTVDGTPACTPGTPGCGWHDGDVVSYGQGSWGAAPAGTNAAALLQANYETVYASIGGLLQVGLPIPAGYSMVFSNATDLLLYLPAIETSGPLTSNLIDPTSSSAGAFGGDVTALHLNIDFSDAGVPATTSGVRFGDLTMCGFSTLPALNGLTVRQFRDVVDTLLGGGTSIYTISQLELTIIELDSAFGGGSVSVFAQDHLVNGACQCTPGTPGCGWHEGDLTTYSQSHWGDITNAAGLLLSARFFDVYPGGIVEVGIPGTAGYSIRFSDPGYVVAYLPAIGASGALTADLIDPSSTSSGPLGGVTLALRLNQDFSSAGLLTGTAGVHLGDLHLCGLTTLTAFNGATVSDFSAIANATLGGATTGYAPADVAILADSIDNAFDSGVPSTFAQDHLVNGACP